MAGNPYATAVIGRTGRGDYGHDLDLAVLDHPALRIVALADDDDAGRGKAAARLKVERTYADYREMLERERPRVVVVAPRWLDGHRAMIEAAIEAGARAILCEKPLAPTLADCDAIVEACDRSHVALAMAYQTRYSPRWEAVKRRIGEGAIGELLELRVRGKEDRRGGGEDLMVLGVHMFDLCRDLLGEPAWCFARVSEGGRPVGRAEVRDGAEGIGPLAGDRVDAMYGFAGSPAVAHFASARPAEPGRRYGLTIGGSKGCAWVSMGWMTPAFLAEDPSWRGAEPAGWEPVDVPGVDPAGGLGVGNRLIVDDLIRAMEADAPPRADARSGRAAVEMVLACYASHARNGVVPMPLTDRETHPLLTLT